jgi:hypothetical protein
MLVGHASTLLRAPVLWCEEAPISFGLWKRPQPDSRSCEYLLWILTYTSVCIGAREGKHPLGHM